MLVSELIAQLQETQSQHGDLVVMTYTADQHDREEVSGQVIFFDEDEGYLFLDTTSCGV